MAGREVEIRAEARQVVVEADGSHLTLDYDRFVLAAGSQLFAPPVPGLAEYALNVDQIEGARALAAHLQALASSPESAARNNAVVAGGGLTGIETAAEMPDRLRGVLGAGAAVRVVVVQRAGGIGPDLGAAPRPVIEAALAECGVEIVPNAAVSAVDAGGVTLSTGLRIDAALRGGKLAQLLNQARSAVTVNSTAGQQVLWRGLPLKAFSRAVYSKPEFFSDQPVEQFFAQARRPDTRAYRDFRHYLLETSQVAGGYYSSRGRRRLMRQVVDMMLDSQDPYDALTSGNAAPRQQLRLVT